MLFQYVAAFRNICLFDELGDIHLEMAAGICFRIDSGLFNFAFIYCTSIFPFPYGLYDPVLRSDIMSNQSRFLHCI